MTRIAPTGGRTAGNLAYDFELLGDDVRSDWIRAERPLVVRKLVPRLTGRQ